MDSLTQELVAAAALCERGPSVWEQRFKNLFIGGVLRLRSPPGGELTLQARPEVSAADPATAASHCLRYLQPALQSGYTAGIDMSALPAEDFSDWLQEYATVFEAALASGKFALGCVRFSLSTAHPRVAEFLQLRGRRALGYPPLALRFDCKTLQNSNPAWKLLVATSHIDQRLSLVPRSIFPPSSRFHATEAGQCVMPSSLFETHSGAAWLCLEIDATQVSHGPAIRAQLAHCVRFVDNLIDLHRWPLPQQNLDSLLNRRVSFHLVRIGQMIVNSGRDPNSFRTLRWLQRWLETVRRCLTRGSNRLAIARGSYPAFGAHELLASLAPRYGVAEADRIVRTCSTRNRHIMALSPFAFFPDELCAGASEPWLNLLPALGRADAVTMYGDERRSSLRLGGWSRLLQMAGATSQLA
jgi:Ribonucleotide reductase, barrel domain